MSPIGPMKAPPTEPIPTGPTSLWPSRASLPPKRADFLGKDRMSIRTGLAGLRFLMGTLLFLFAVISAVSAEPEKRAPSRIAFCGNYAYPPFSMIDSKGNPAGFSVELIKAIGREVGMEVEIRLLPWSEARAALETEHIADVSTMFYSEERDRIFDF